MGWATAANHAHVSPTVGCASAIIDEEEANVLRGRPLNNLAAVWDHPPTSGKTSRSKRRLPTKGSIATVLWLAKVSILSAETRANQRRYKSDTPSIQPRLSG
eukprot:936596-Pyramimonas_sp.AAC.1